MFVCMIKMGRRDRGRGGVIYAKGNGRRGGAGGGKREGCMEYVCVQEHAWKKQYIGTCGAAWSDNP